MAWTQTASVNTGVQDRAGWCLRFVQSVFNAPVKHPSAWAAWNATTLKHQDRNLPNVAVPCWFSHIGNYDGTGMKNWGHVVAYIPGSGFLSSPGSGYGQKWFGSIEEIERYFRCTYVGWSEDINGLQVATWSEDKDTPAPVPTQRTYTVVPGDTLWGIATLYYNDGSKYPVIAEANGIGNPNLIFPGQTFIIP
jgi:hypothetical protein